GFKGSGSVRFPPYASALRISPLSMSFVVDSADLGQCRLQARVSFSSRLHVLDCPCDNSEKKRSPAAISCYYFSPLASTEPQNPATFITRGFIVRGPVFC